MKDREFDEAIESISEPDEHGQCRTSYRELDPCWHGHHHAVPFLLENGSVPTVPEPEEWMLIVVVCILLLWMLRRRTVTRTALAA
jgi:hypothetical protein